MANRFGLIYCNPGALELDVDTPPDLSAAISNFQAGEFAAAERVALGVLATAPANTVALQIAGLCAYKRGRNNEAAEILRRCVSLQPDVADFRNSLGAVFLRMGREAEASELCRSALKLRPDYPEACMNLGIALERLGQFEEAEAVCRRAVYLSPGYTGARIALLGALRGQGRLDEAAATLEESIRAKPDAEALSALGAILLEAGRLDDALRSYRWAIELDPRDSNLHSRLLYALHYHPDYDPERLLQEHLAWAARHAEPLYPAIRPYENDPSPDRRLRIGYVSADFRRHSVATFLEPLIVGHDADQSEVYCYSDVRRPDDVTRRFQVATDVWRTIIGMSDEQVAELIRRDRIDILVDPAGHMGPNRPLLFARKPAPVQIAYPGYPGSSGLKTMDYFVTDAYQDPPGMTEGHYVEKLIRLPGSCRCYRPPEDAPESSEPPSLHNGCVTFGSINRIEKVTPQTMRPGRRCSMPFPALV
jgi:predicted O-linked N-acetylglucosamine transferase (SPINDLY family)